MGLAACVICREPMRYGAPTGPERERGARGEGQGSHQRVDQSNRVYILGGV